MVNSWLSTIVKKEFWYEILIREQKARKSLRNRWFEGRKGQLFHTDFCGNFGLDLEAVLDVSRIQ